MDTLNKFEIAALRKADNVIFRHGLNEGDNVIEAVKEARPTTRDPFASEVRHVIKVQSTVQDYATHEHTPKGYAAFYRESSAQYSRTWRTIAGLLRDGDEVGLVWVAANDNDYLHAAGLHHDELYLTVVRNGKHVMTLEVGDGICADNSARMVRTVH